MNGDAHLHEEMGSLAQAHLGTLAPTAQGSLGPRLDELERGLAAVYRRVGETRYAPGERPGAVEWLLDNGYVIQNGAEQVRANLPPGFYRRLPSLREGPDAGLTRVEALARQLVNEAAGPVDLGATAVLLDAYQAVAPLSVGELWALPAMMRLIVLEALLPDAAAAVGLARAETPPTRPRLPGDDAVARAVRSLRVLAGHDWKDFVERASHLHRLLGDDPSGDYARMDFASRDRYRKAVERLARRTAEHDELGVARVALELAAAAPADARAGHVGTYLIAEGRTRLEEAIGYAPSPWLRAGRTLEPHAPTIYLSTIALGALVALALPLLWLASIGASGWAILGAAAFALVPAWTLAANVTDWLVTLLVPARRLPRMDAEESVPADGRTIVVTPVILRSVAEVDGLLATLEVNYLGNRDERLGFALLTDLADAPTQHLADDDAVIAAMSDGIRRLNARYASPDGGPRFHLLHRERRWNAVERVWMGWERKRGKLEEFNALVTGRGATSFRHLVDLPDDLSSVRYVLTLDADTRLPPGSARELVAAFRHPLVRPVVDPESHALLAGFTVLQPRLESDATAAVETGFARAMTGEGGVDLYAQVVSNVHHDLFARAIFMGKGIYDVDAFERCLRGRVPENRLLSHDLFEGVHGRVGLVSDVTLFEQQPANALGFAQRLHRWVRGDWQLLPWLISRRSPGRDGRLEHGLSPLARFTVADNLRRSLFLPTLLGLLIGAWFTLPDGGAAVATLAIVALLGAPIFLTVLGALARGLPGRTPLRALEAAGHAARMEGARVGLTLALLPHQAMVTGDAIVRAVWRVYVSRRGLLQWTSAAHSAGAIGDTVGLPVALRHMAGAVAVAAAVTLGLVAFAPTSLPAALPLLVAWLLAPWIVARTSRSALRPREMLTLEQRRALRLLARRTWHFFAELVGPRDHWLPPDHLQEDPGPMLARRTSPTNIGMMLASTLGAYDLGFIEARSLANRVRETLDTLDRLERHRGHWLNWYGTHDLEPLAPRYVSTVDSGNLAAALLVVARGLDDARREGVPYAARTRGLADTVAVLDDILARLRPRLAERASHRAIDAQRATLAELEELLRDAATLPLLQRRRDIAAAEAALQTVAERLVELLEAEPRVPHATLSELRAWLEQALRETRAARAEIDASVPWLDLVADPPEALQRSELAAIEPTMRYLSEALAEPLDLSEVHELAARCRSLAGDMEAQLRTQPPSPAATAARAWGADVLAAVDGAIERALQLDADLASAAGRCRRAAAEMDFAFLYDRSRDLFHIGYHMATGELDVNHYDLLASEARTASLLAIASGEAPTEHWLQLGRPLARVGGTRVLLSWSATMFEYLMPRLFLRHPERTLLHESCHTALEQQIAYARRYGVPWGVSESAFAELGTQGDYQYRAFGVPEVGLKRDLGRRLVIAPYASVLALPLRPREAMANVERLAELGALGRYGLIDALDYGEVDGGTALPIGPGADAGTAARQPHLVRTFMAHHQGMILVAAVNQLLHDRMVERLHAEPSIASVELLLHERSPIHVPPSTRWRRAEAAAAEPGAAPTETAGTWGVDPRGGIDHAMPLSNGATSTLLRAAGGGGASWGGVVLTRDQPHDSGGARGTTIYLRDLDDGDLWSTTLDPIGGDPADCEATFGAHAVRYRRRRGDLVAREEVVVAPRDALELRRVSVTNEGDRTRRLAVASYAEVVLGSVGEDARHPAFSKLFVSSEASDDLSTLTFRRRRRTPEEKVAVMAHRLMVEAPVPLERTACADRRAFLGRGGSLRAPLAPTLRSGTRPSDGFPLDPVASLGCLFELAPGATAQLVFVTATGWSDEAVVAALRQAGTHAQVAHLVDRAAAAADEELRGLGIGPDALPDLADLLALAHAPREVLRAGLSEAEPILPILWSQGVSGDLPIVLVRIAHESFLPFVVQLLRGHTWWRGRQIGVDLVVLDEVSSGYEQPLRDRLEGAMQEVARLGRGQGPGRAAIVPVARAGPAIATLMASAAVVLDAGGPPLRDQLARAATRPAPAPAFVPVPGPQPPAPEIAPLPPLERTDFAGLGGFAGQVLGAVEHAPALDAAAGNPGHGALDAAAGDPGRARFDDADVVLHLEPGGRTPAPWINVIAHGGFGFLVSESGASTTWGANSGERRLTPWPNDPVRDPSGEAIYIRDEETGEVWSPTPAPAPAGAAYRVRHGAGVSTFSHRSHGLEHELELFVDPEASVKLLRLRLRDEWDRPRRLTVTGYVEWVLGTLRARQAPFLVPSYDAETGALLARTLLGPMADGSVAFLAASRPAHGLTTDRFEFLGPEGDLARPAGLQRVGLSGAVRPGHDPCAALQVHVDLEPGGTTELHFVIGLGADQEAALALIRRFRAPEAAADALARVRAGWRTRLGRIEVRTPEPALDHLLNRWLPYQALACRIWGRTALYQSSGAYGFRDQLQDAANLAPLEPELVRAQLLRAAARQFEEGDVLHWWHPDSGAGVRTRYSDDLLWLPWACARYLERGGDEAVLHERVPYLRAPVLGKDEVERYDHYAPGDRDGTLLDHCLRALDRGDTRGPHGLPLIGGGDWNDGMNRLGLRGRGESVWLGWFLCTALEDGAALCERVGDHERAARYRERRAELAADLERHAWDGAWYRRAYADDGSPIGSRQRSEAQIDLIAQAWSVLSGAGDRERSITAMASARERLWQRDDGVLLLLAPPFEVEDPDPGYIRAYPPGVRENGGQYTHAAIWGAWAMADLGDGDAAVDLLRSLGGITRARTAAAAERYRVEPYVVAADVYGVGPYAGRGGWTWYTGAAGWLYRFGIERVLGVRVRGDRLEIDPCIAADWPGFGVTVRHGGARYEVVVENPHGVHEGVASLRLDGEPVEVPSGAVASVPLVDDGKGHRVEVGLGVRGA
jgi:cyclic beta-1,2-glucan synthetase